MAKQARPNDVPWLMPYLVVKDAERSLDFYQRAFGLVKRTVMTGDDGKITHAEVVHKDAVIMFAPEEGYGTAARTPASTGTLSSVTLYVYVEDVDALCRQAEAAGAQVSQQPADMFWGDRMCSLIDPDGHTWNFATHLGEGPGPG